MCREVNVKGESLNAMLSFFPGAAKGYVMHPSKNDLSTFVLDRRELGQVAANAYLWDYVAADVSSQW